MSPGDRGAVAARLALLRSRLRGVAARRHAPEPAGRLVLDAFAADHPGAVFLEIGANDGEREDHLAPFIRDHGWTGVMIEPVPEVFERLRSNYGDLEGVALENVAVSDHDGRLPFHVLVSTGEGDAPRIDGADMFGSLSPAAVDAIAGAFPDAPRHIETIEVPCLSFESLCARHSIERLDLLVVDTEGHDHVILGQVDFERLRPRVVAYEYCHMPEEARREWERRFEAMGYESMDEALDTWCVDVRPDDALTRRWREIRARGPAVSEEDLKRWFEA